MGDDKKVQFLAASDYIEENVPEDDMNENSRRDILREAHGGV